MPEDFDHEKPQADRQMMEAATELLRQKAIEQADKVQVKQETDYQQEARQALQDMMEQAAKFVGIRPEPWAQFDEAEVTMWCRVYNMSPEEAKILNSIPYRIMNIAVHGIRTQMKRPVIPTDRILLAVDGRPWAQCVYKDIMDSAVEPWPKPLDVGVTFALDEPSLAPKCDVFVNIPGEQIREDHLIEKSAVYMAIEMIRQKHEAVHLKEEAEKLSAESNTASQEEQPKQ